MMTQQQKKFKQHNTNTCIASVIYMYWYQLFHSWCACSFVCVYVCAYVRACLRMCVCVRTRDNMHWCQQGGRSWGEEKKEMHVSLNETIRTPLEMCQRIVRSRHIANALACRECEIGICFHSRTRRDRVAFRVRKGWCKFLSVHMRMWQAHVIWTRNASFVNALHISCLGRGMRGSRTGIVHSETNYSMMTHTVCGVGLWFVRKVAVVWMWCKCLSRCVIRFFEQRNIMLAGRIESML